MNLSENLLDPKVAAQLEEYYIQSGASVPRVLADMIETSFLPTIEGTLKPGEAVTLPALSKVSPPA